MMAQPMAASAGIVSTPSGTVPRGPVSHRLSGMVKVALPGATSVSRKPVSREIGGNGVSPLRIARSCAMPGQVSPSGRG